MEKVKAQIMENLQQTGDSDESLLEMYEQKEALEKGTAEAEQEYYAWRATITESENEVSKLRQKKTRPN
jgi:chromosome segregation protein